MTGQGELQIRLSVDNLTEITLLRPPQEDMTVSFASNLISTSKARMLNEAIYSISKSPSTRTYIFSSLRGQVIRYSQKKYHFLANSSSDLHSFQAATTGFSVLYEGYLVLA